ncbi:DNA repair protein RadC [Sphingosinicella sp. YJ22]|uniref:RadC family protein n=1 Tax=Sphingosinicella sp. YJ22 TaxID=1104780 RepID=UPI00140AA619|nr:DNA repair protein RadC [Sphingosinicella sp. YJ22]
MGESDPVDHSGHRARLRQRLAEGGPDALLDHELVEYLLGLNTPRRDQKPLAKQLIARFGGFGALLSADHEALERAGLTEGQVAALKIAQASALRLLRAEIAEQPILGSWQALLDYLHADMAHLAVERVRVLFLDSKNRLIRDEPMWEGSVDESAVYVREIVRRALDYQATGLIIVHNHPSGDPRPSPQDIAITKDIADAARHLRITLHDHVIIGRTGHASLRALGLM